MTPKGSFIRSCFCLLFGFVTTGGGILSAHPLPDLPVRSYFSKEGSVEVRVEVDPRSFEANPEAKDYLTKAAAHGLPPAETKALHDQAERYIENRIALVLEPLGEVKPEFHWEWRKLKDEAFTGKDDDPAVLVGLWKTTIPGGVTAFRLKAKHLESGKIPLNVVFLNFIDGVQAERYAVLFPGETSFSFDLTGLTADVQAAPSDASGMKATTADWWAIFLSEIKRGFLHVVPLGLDHILFVLGLFLMSREWKPLLLQVTSFTLAHTLTLWLASAGMVNLSPKIVEPIIAASIVAVAMENIFRPHYTHWRLLVVLIFGLIHGLGFAGVMSTKLDSTSSLIIGLLGINLGVELGQIAVITAAFLATCWIRSPGIYRRWIVVPGSILIAIAGAWWVLERTLLSS